MDTSIPRTAIHDDPRGGDASGSESLFPLVYEELRRIARFELSRLPAGQTLQATALVHEVWLRLSESDGAAWANRAHFLAVAARAIRQIVIDAARRRSALKRGGNCLRVELDNLAISTDLPADDLLTLDEALEELTNHAPLGAKIVNLRYFAGATIDEVATAVDVSRRTVEREWEYARAWLFSRVRTGRVDKVAPAPNDLE